jgi:hypothetical protein
LLDCLVLDVWHEVQNWRVLSDHRIISFEVYSDYGPPYQYRNPLKTADQGCRTLYWDFQFGKLRKTLLEQTTVPFKYLSFGCKSIIWQELLKGHLGGPFAMKWNVLYHPPDCIGFFQKMFVIRRGHLDFPRVILQARMGRLQSTCL